MTNPIVISIDDSENDTLLMETAARRVTNSFHLRVFNDVETAIAYLDGLSNANEDRDSFPALILLDLKMPRKSGFEVLDKIRANNSLKNVPVVILTSSQHREDVRRSYALGASGYLVKPVDFDLLMELMDRVGQVLRGGDFGRVFGGKTDFQSRSGDQEK